MASERNYGIDLLRMIAMLMVVILHILGQGGVYNSAPVFSARYETAWFLETAAYCAVNVYALISGYVGIRANYRYTNIVLLWFRVVFYTLLITVLFRIFAPQTVGPEQWLNVFFPVFTNQYWYFSAYFGMFFLIPVWNLAANTMNRKQFRAVLLVLFLLFSLMQTVIGQVFGTTSGYTCIWLGLLYLGGAYIRKYDPMKNVKISACVIGFFLMIVISWGVKWLMQIGMQYYPKETMFGSWLTEYYRSLIKYISPTMVAAAVFLLRIFEKKKLSEKTARLIRIWSPLAFSVYIIHAHPLLWDYVIKNRFKGFASLPAPVLALAVLLTAVLIFLLCLVIDFGREWVFRVLKLRERLLYAEEKFVGGLWTDPEKQTPMAAECMQPVSVDGKPENHGERHNSQKNICEEAEESQHIR